MVHVVMTVLGAVGLAFVLPASPAGAAAPSATRTRAKVIRWVDGDTLVTDHSRIRLIGVDAPEKRRCGAGRAAKDERRIGPQRGAPSVWAIRRAISSRRQLARREGEREEPAGKASPEIHRLQPGGCGRIAVHAHRGREAPGPGEVTGREATRRSAVYSWRYRGTKLATDPVDRVW